MTATTYDEQLERVVQRLIEASVEDYYNPYRTFEWPDSISPESLWMSRDLLSLYGTAVAETLDEEQIIELSRWEGVNLYCLIAHGIRELLIEVVMRIYKPGYEIATPYFHHFIGEENEHMWFFAEFCLRYGGKIYPDRHMAFPAADRAPEVNNFIVFSQILIFEQIGDYFNARMAADDTLPHTVRQVNHIHHKDESRHIAFGAKLVAVLYDRMCQSRPAAEVQEAATAVRRYIDVIIQRLYNVEAYRDAGIPNPEKFRAAVMADPARKIAHDRITHRTMSFYKRIGAFT